MFDDCREIALLFLLPLPIASIAWTVTHEELFHEPRAWCAGKSRTCRHLYARKFFYLFTCEFCFSHYVTAFFLVITRCTLLFNDWRGYLISFFALVWVANIYMSAFGRLRLDIREERLTIAAAESRQPMPVVERPPTFHGRRTTIAGLSHGALHTAVESH